jgi:hypothetical protein
LVLQLRNRVIRLFVRDWFSRFPEILKGAHMEGFLGIQMFLSITVGAVFRAFRRWTHFLARSVSFGQKFGYCQTIKSSLSSADEGTFSRGLCRWVHSV